MKASLERGWVAFLDSERFRRFTKQGVGSRIFHSRAYDETKKAKNFVASYYQTRTNPALFQDVGTFCFFIGHTKSGGTMIGSLLDAHPNVILADEIDALKYVGSGLNKEQIYYTLLKGSRREAMKGRVTARRLQPYSFAVPDQWQGRYKKLQVIGDSKAGPTTRRLGANPELLEKTVRLMTGVDVRLVQVIRNPFDPISVMMVRGKRTFENASEHYFNYCDTLLALRARLDDSALLPVRYESFVRNPAKKLAEICRFVGVAAGDDYLNACVAIVREEPDRSREMITWEPGWIQIVEERLGRYDFLQGYSFES